MTSTTTIDAAFKLGNEILTARGWDHNEHGDWVRPEDNRPARLRATPDFQGGNTEMCARLEIAFAQLAGEPTWRAMQQGKSEVLWQA